MFYILLLWFLFLANAGKIGSLKKRIREESSDSEQVAGAAAADPPPRLRGGIRQRRQQANVETSHSNTFSDPLTRDLRLFCSIACMIGFCIDLYVALVVSWIFAKPVCFWVCTIFSIFLYV